MNKFLRLSFVAAANKQCSRRLLNHSRMLSTTTPPPPPSDNSSALPQSISETPSSVELPRPLDTTVPWKWLPPPPRPIQTLEDEAKGQRNPSVARPKLNTHIKVIPKVHLTKEEIMESFVLHGASNVLWKPCGNLADAMVFATARSNAHAKMLAEVVVRATRDRKLYTFNKYMPIEGVDDWFLVDTGSLMVNCFSGEKKRKEVDLEGHLDQLAKHSKELKEKWGHDADPAFLQAELEKVMKVDDPTVPDGTETVPGFKDDGKNYAKAEAAEVGEDFDLTLEQQRKEDDDEIEEADGGVEFAQALEEMDKRAKLRKRQLSKKKREAALALEANKKKDMTYFTGISPEQVDTSPPLQEVGEDKDDDEVLKGITSVIRGSRRSQKKTL